MNWFCFAVALQISPNFKLIISLKKYQKDVETILTTSYYCMYYHVSRIPVCGDVVCIVVLLFCCILLYLDSHFD